MNELRQILHAVASTDEPLHLATVVDVDGSAYRRPGARMLVLPDGGHIGAISGGCLERDLCRQAATICKRGPRLICFDTRSEAMDLNARYGLGCSGVIYVLVEPVTRDDRCPIRRLQEVFETRLPQVVGTVYQTSGGKFSSLQLGQRFADIDLSLSGLFANSYIVEELRYWFGQTRATSRPVCCQLTRSGDDPGESGTRVFIELLSPPKPLWIFGAGDDAIPLAMIAGDLGWCVSVIDDRPGNLTRSRFPTVDRLVLGAREEARRQLPATPQTAAVLMTHHLKKDAEIVPWLCGLQLSYVGLLGPKSRTGELIKHIHAAGNLPPLVQLDKLHTPVGLDIGASNPGEVAVSIVAEIIAVDRRRSGRPLAQRNGPIHHPVAHRLIDSRTPQTKQAFAWDHE
ncbi:putative xanthine dehydrogenase subunit A [Pirellulimonas nuda]|uniref:Putative xanthine dehydrogenase subunit A n=1 Tax=Pirellulimonas nuda TaxID=2528009 RepID=A0A518DDA2_9BACT|nr:XdhC/CoxI family protein [Pirellulimonas nuda]QDU89465.1 putative xanthine dehydrogenase subunit A [Pirellulimonas nuda]